MRGDDDPDDLMLRLASDDWLRTSIGGCAMLGAGASLPPWTDAPAVANECRGEELPAAGKANATLRMAGERGTAAAPTGLDRGDMPGCGMCNCCCCCCAASIEREVCPMVAERRNGEGGIEAMLIARPPCCGDNASFAPWLGKCSTPVG